MFKAEFERIRQKNRTTRCPADLGDIYIPGSPPHPLTILDGSLRLLGRR
jgi:Ni,Fe-hydrogenase III small subunit